MASTPCSECDEEIDIAGRVRLGQKVLCNHCGAALEVVATEPLELEMAADDEDEVWEEDELEDEVLIVALSADDEDADDADDDDELEELDDFEDELEDELDDDFDDDDFDDDFDDFDDDDFDDDLDDDDDRWS